MVGRTGLNRYGRVLHEIVHHGFSCIPTSTTRTHALAPYRPDLGSVPSATLPHLITSCTKSNRSSHAKQTTTHDRWPGAGYYGWFSNVNRGKRTKAQESAQQGFPAGTVEIPPPPGSALFSALFKER